MQSFDKTKLLISSWVAFVFVVIFSSTVIISTALLLPNRPLISVLAPGVGDYCSQNPTDPACQYSGSPTIYTNNAKLEQTKVLKNKGTVLLISGKYNDSITYFDKVLSINPNDIAALNGKGQALARLGKYNESITYFDKVLSINPNDIAALNSKGLVLLSASKYNESIKFFDKVLSINPNNVMALSSKGQALARLGKYNDSIAVSIRP